MRANTEQEPMGSTAGTNTTGTTRWQPTVVDEPVAIDPLKAGQSLPEKGRVRRVACANPEGWATRDVERCVQRRDIRHDRLRQRLTSGGRP